MSNEQDYKWFSDQLIDAINRLESENAELQHRLNDILTESVGTNETLVKYQTICRKLESENAELREEVERLQCIKSLGKDYKNLYLNLLDRHEHLREQLAQKISERDALEFKMQSQRPKLVDATPRTDADGWKQMCEKLIGFTEHDTDCRANKSGNVRQCTCGLTDLINQFRKEGEQNG